MLETADAAPDAPPGPGPRTWAALAAVAGLLAAWLLGAGHGGGIDAAGAVGDSTRAEAMTGPIVAPGATAAMPGAGRPAPAPMPAAVPVTLDIASLGIHAPLVGRGLADGTVEPPPYATPGTAGWYRDGPAPGAAGTAIIVGHVDTQSGPAVFYPLGTAARGAAIEVTRADGSVARFTVDAVETVPKDRFDPARVYGTPTGPPALHLITCGGTFDRTQQAYTANIVVSATFTASHQAPPR